MIDTPDYTVGYGKRPGTAISRRADPAIREAGRRARRAQPGSSGHILDEKIVIRENGQCRTIVGAGE
jgi:hypothetical protein